MQVGFSKKKIYIDEGLFERILQGEQDAFRELYELTYRPLYAFLLSLTQNSEDAQDLLQDTYIQIRANCHQYQCRGNPMAWMMKISKNLFLMKCRQEKNRASVSYEEIEKELGFGDLSNVDNRLLLEKMFSILSDEERNIIIMKDVNGLKHKEIADLMEKPVGTVLAKYNRGIRKLQKNRIQQSFLELAPDIYDQIKDAPLPNADEIRQFNEKSGRVIKDQDGIDSGIYFTVQVQ